MEPNPISKGSEQLLQLRGALPGTSREYQIALSRWDNEGGAGANGPQEGSGKSKRGQPLSVDVGNLVSSEAAPESGSVHSNSSTTLSAASPETDVQSAVTHAAAQESNCPDWNRSF
jgi:hypothetical protein